MSDSLRPHESQDARPPCPSSTPRVHPNSCPLSQWWHSTISSSVVPFSSWPQSFPVSGSFQMSQLFTSGDQSIGVSASTSLLPLKIQHWSPVAWTCWIQWIEHHKVGRCLKKKKKIWSILSKSAQTCVEFLACFCDKIMGAIRSKTQVFLLRYSLVFPRKGQEITNSKCHKMCYLITNMELFITALEWQWWDLIMELTRV